MPGIVVIVGISEAQFRWGVIGAAVVVALGIASVRFFGSVTLPPKSTARTEVSGTANQLMTKTSGTQSVYSDFLVKDAATAGVPAPTLEDMRREFKSFVDDNRHVLDVGGKPIDAAGLRLAVTRSGDTIVLEIQNTTQTDLAYLVQTTPTPATASCNSARPLPFDAMVIRKGQREARVECGFRNGMVIAVTRIETVEVPPLSAWYLSQLPPELVGIEDRIARGHRGAQTKEKCSPLMGEALRRGIESREIRWRDLVDFYARHRCQTFHFPMTYKAFVANDPRTPPIGS